MILWEFANYSCWFSKIKFISCSVMNLWNVYIIPFLFLTSGFDLSWWRRYSGGGYDIYHPRVVVITDFANLTEHSWVSFIIETTITSHSPWWKGKRELAYLVHLLSSVDKQPLVLCTMRMYLWIAHSLLLAQWKVSHRRGCPISWTFVTEEWRSLLIHLIGWKTSVTNSLKLLKV